MAKYKYDAVATLTKSGISQNDAVALRRISMTLKSWYIHECNGTICREDVTRIPYSYYRPDIGQPMTRGARVADREAGAIRRLRAIIARYPGFASYVQGDPRGCVLYVMRPGDLSDGAALDSNYNRGVAVY
jgi:hypothetical protein